jgi:dipeptidyl aminopeptidase/acylaminoacyl peptidase
MKRIVIILLCVGSFLLCAGLVALDYTVTNILPYSPIRPYRCTLVDVQKLSSGVVTPFAAGLLWKKFDIPVEDSILLRGWFVYAKKQPAQGTVLVLHGIGSCKAAMIPLAVVLTHNGFNCILYDSRANGESGGINCTFGYYEKRDVSRYIDSAIVRFPHSAPYAIYGHSLGAAVAIQALAEDRRLVCGIAESPFADLRESIHDYFAKIIHFHLNFIPDKALVYTERIARFPIDSVRPIASAQRIQCPTMIIHGLQDQNISVVYGKQVFDQINERHKEWLPIPGGGHNDLMRVGGMQYKQRVVQFLKTYVSATAR